MVSEDIFNKAVQAIDMGDTNSIQQLLQRYPTLVSTRCDTPPDGYFNHPFLLWFIANNPIRSEKMPPNIVAITGFIIDQARIHAADSFSQQLNYTLGLVATGRIARESGVQIELIDLLLHNGAKAETVEGALAQGNFEAAKHLISKGARLTLTAAICLDYKDEISTLSKKASADEKQIALIAAAFYGNAKMISFLLGEGADPNKYIESSSGFHSHATALHQAVFSGSLASVKILLEAGANPVLTDRIYHGTALGWAKHLQTEEKDEAVKKKYFDIEKYLSE